MLRPRSPALRAALTLRPTYRPLLALARFNSSDAPSSSPNPTEAQTPAEALKAARKAQDKLNHNWDQPTLSYEQVKPRTISPSPVRPSLPARPAN